MQIGTYNMKKNLSDEEMVTIEKIITKANNSELRYILNILEKEIRLSEVAIKEGFEKRE